MPTTMVTFASYGVGPVSSCCLIMGFRNVLRSLTSSSISGSYQLLKTTMNIMLSPPELCSGGMVTVWVQFFSKVLTNSGTPSVRFLKVLTNSGTPSVRYFGTVSVQKHISVLQTPQKL